MRACPKCHLQIENAAAKFCRRCGTQLPPAAVPSPEVEPRELEEPASVSCSTTPPPPPPRTAHSTSTYPVAVRREPRVSLSPGFPSTGEDADVVERPKTYLVWAILSTSLCGVFGIYAIYCATQVDSCWTLGQPDEARMWSRKAKKWCWLSPVSLLLSIGIYIIFMAILIGLG